MSAKTGEIVELLGPAVADLGLILLGVEYAPSYSRALLRLYIDADGRHVTLDDCEAVSREVSALLDVHDPITSQYTLEVSSPGIDRPLFNTAQVVNHLGEQAKAQLKLPIDGRRRVQGKLLRVEGDLVTFALDESEFSVDFENIEKIRLVPDLVALGLAPNKSEKPGRARRGSGTKPGKPAKS